MINILKNYIRSVRILSNRLFHPSPFIQPKFKGKDFGFSRGTPIDRIYIEKFLETSRQYIRGNVLEFGDNHYYKKFCVDKNSTCEIFTSKLDNREDGVKRIHGDLTQLNELPHETYDTIICTNVLNFIYDVNSAADGLYKLLKPGGTCLITLASFSTHISKYDSDRWGDYWRFSEKSAIKLFENKFTIENRYVFGNSYSSVAQMYGYCLEELDMKKIFNIEFEYTMIVCLILKKPNE
jgi:hypothetical protein